MKTEKFLLLFMTWPLLFGCETKKEGEQFITNIEQSHEYSYKDVKEYEIAWESIFDVEEETYYVYFYSLTCSHCEEMKNYIIEKGLKNKNIYFVKSSNKDQLSNNPETSIGAENPGDIWILGYPSLLKIKEKKCIKNLAGNQQIKIELN